MKLAIGTVQFGIPYGVANQVGQTDIGEAKQILDYAWSMGINTIDTAIAYGDSEEVLGKIGIEKWQVISKLPAIPDFCGDITKWVQDSVSESLSRLKISKLSGLLLHQAQQLNEASGLELYQALLTLKKQGLVDKIGVSIYDPDELERILSTYKLDLVQAPLNIIDRRLLNTGWISQLKSKKIELHIRSTFLQGLLLMKNNERPKKFDRWNEVWEGYDNWLSKSNLSSLQACIRYPLSFDEIDRVIIGVDTCEQLREIIDASSGTLPSLPDSIMVTDLDLINPAKWTLL